MFQPPKPRNPVEAALLIRVAARALVLFSESGYTYRKEDGKYPYYLVYSPEGKTYLVDPPTESCTCPFWKDHLYCKHSMAILEVLEDEARVAKYEAECAEQAIDREIAFEIDYQCKRLGI